MSHAAAYNNADLFFLCLQIVTAAGRFFVRGALIGKFGLDDAALFLTLILSTAFISCECTIYYLTGNLPIVKLPWDKLQYVGPGTKLTLAGDVLYICGTMFLKISIGLLLLRILVKRWHRMTIYVIMVVSTVYGIFYAFFVLFMCGNPIYFTKRILLGQCLSWSAAEVPSYLHAVLSAIADFTCAIIPILFVWDADLDKRSKVSVAAILALASAGCVTTLVRIAYVRQLYSTTSAYWIHTEVIATASIAELSLGITCVSLATYKPLFRRYFSRGRYYYYSYTNEGSRTSQVPVTEHGPPEEINTESDPRTSSGASKYQDIDGEAYQLRSQASTGDSAMSVGIAH